MSTTKHKFKRIEAEYKTYYIDTEVVNAADHVLVDTLDPNSRGFGGSTFLIRTTDHAVDTVKGPWHGTCPYEVFEVSELHDTKVLIVANYERIPWGKRNIEAMNRGCTCIECRHHIRGDVIYEENERVLGAFYRGDRIAQQLANVRDEVLYLHVETAGGSHSSEVKPGGKLHPLAYRSGRRTSTEQGGIIYDHLEIHRSDR